MPVGDQQVMISRVQAWVRPQLLDAEESRRSWHLKCIQAEAELRALQGKAPVRDSELRSPRPLEYTGSFQRSPGGESPLSPRSPQGAAEDQSLQTLAKALALEQHLSELESLRAYVDQEMSAVRLRCDSLEVRLQDERAATSAVGERARAARDQARDLVDSHALQHSEHCNACDDLRNESRRIAQDASNADVIDKKLANAENDRKNLVDVVGKLEEECRITQEERERLWMSREDALTWSAVYNAMHTQSAREAAAAKRTLQARSAALKRVESEAQKSRTKSERTRRQVDGQLRQCRSELADAVSRADYAGEQLRMVQQKHGKELRGLRSKTEGLQSEVDEHLHRMSYSEADLEGLHKEEADMASERERLERTEQQLESEAIDLRMEAERLEQEVSNQELSWTAARGRLRDAEVAHTETMMRNLLLAEEKENSEAGKAEKQAMRVECQAQLSEEQQTCISQGADVRNLEALQANVSQLREKKSELTQEHVQLQETVKQAQRGNEKSLADFQEAIRRASRVKAQHADLQGVMPTSGTKGREALVATVDPAMVRVCKKVDLLLSCLESLVSGPSKTPRAERAENQESAAAQRGQAALQRRLLVEWEKDMEHRLAEERRKVVLEQQKSLDAAKQNASDLQRARHERRRLEEELGRARDTLEWARRSGESELEGLRAQVRLVEREATEEAETVTAEFSDLLQKEALERDNLQAQVDQLREEVASSPASPQNLASSASNGNVNPGTLKEGDASSSSAAATGSPKAAASNADAAGTAAQEEAAALAAEEAELLHAHVQLKAALIAKRQRLQERARTGGRPTLDTAATRRHGSSASRGGSRGSAKGSGDTLGPSGHGGPESSGKLASARSSPSKDLSSREVLAVTPATPMSASRRSESRRTSAGGSPTPTTTVVTMVTTEDMREEVSGAVANDESLASEPLMLLHSPAPPSFPQSPQQLNHHRTVSTRTVSTSGSSQNLHAPVPALSQQLGQQLTASTRSLSSHSVSTSASAMPGGSFGAAATGPASAVAANSALSSPTALQRSSKGGAVYTWPTGQPNATQQDRKDTRDPRAMVTLG